MCIYLELVLAGLVLRARVEKVDGENLQRRCVSRGVRGVYYCLVAAAVRRVCCRVRQHFLLLSVARGIGIPSGRTILAAS
jgi:hypothetical protein